MARGDYDKSDAQRDTGASQREVSSTWHSARDDAFGSKEEGSRNYDSGGDRPTSQNRSDADSLGREHGLGGEGGDGGSK